MAQNHRLAKMGMGPLYVAPSFRRKFRWQFRILSGDLEIIEFVCKSVTLPRISFEEHEAKHQIETIHFAGRPTWEPIELVLIDMVTDTTPSSTLGRIRDWVKVFYDSGREGNSTARENIQSWNYAEFKKNCELVYLDQRANPTGVWLFEGAYPSSIDLGGLDYSSSEVGEISLTLRYDRARYEDIRR